MLKLTVVRMDDTARKVDLAREAQAQAERDALRRRRDLSNLKWLIEDYLGEAEKFIAEVKRKRLT